LIAELSTTRRKAGRGTLAWSGMINRKLPPKGVYKIMLVLRWPSAVRGWVKYLKPVKL
jgi:hypothetical protein